jgi:hypothetical protein
MKMEAQNIAQRYAIFFCVKLGDSATTIHGKRLHAFGDYAVSKAQPFAGTVCFLKAEPLLKMRGDNTTQVRELVRSDRISTVGMIPD